LTQYNSLLFLSHPYTVFKSSACAAFKRCDLAIFAHSKMFQQIRSMTSFEQQQQKVRILQSLRTSNF